MGKGFDKFLNMIRLNDEDYDDYADHQDFKYDSEYQFADLRKGAFMTMVKRKRRLKKNLRNRNTKQNLLQKKYRNTRLRSSLHRRLLQHRHLPPAVRLSQ